MSIRASGSSIVIEDCRVIKQSDPALMKFEYEKHRKAYELGIESGLFKVPKIYDYKKGVLTMEYFHNAQTFDSIKHPSKDLINKVARSLVFIHSNLILANDEIEYLPGNKKSKYEVFLHGDFNGANVCFDKIDGSIIILDWQTSYIYGGRATFDTLLFDVVCFATYSLWHPRMKNIYFLKTIKDASLFVESYIGDSSLDISMLDVYNYALLFFQKELDRRSNQNSNQSIKEKLYLTYAIFLNRFFLRLIKRKIIN
jgi:hypothetical protein